MVRDNRGVTLIEIIIVIMILGILAVGSTLGYRLLDRGNSKSTAKKIGLMLEYTRLENMTKSNYYYLVIEQEASSKDYSLSIWKEPSLGSRELVSKERLKLKSGEIAFRYGDMDSFYLISKEGIEGKQIRDRLEIGFRKDTGGVKADMSGSTVEEIRISSLNRDYSIRLVKATGKVIEK